MISPQTARQALLRVDQMAQSVQGILEGSYLSASTRSSSRRETSSTGAEGRAAGPAVRSDQVAAEVFWFMATTYSKRHAVAASSPAAADPSVAAPCLCKRLRAAANPAPLQARRRQGRERLD